MDKNQKENIEKIRRDFISTKVKCEFEKVSTFDIWDSFQPDTASEAMFLNGVRSSNCFAIDEQSCRFAQLLSIATCFSSLQYAEKLHKVSEFVESIKILLQTMKSEVKEDRDTASEMETLKVCFTRMVDSVQHNVNLMLPLLKTAVNQMIIIDDAMNPHQNQKELSKEDKKDIQLALSRMSNGIENLPTKAESARYKDRERDEKISLMANSIESKKIYNLSQVDIVNFCLTFNKPITATSIKAVNEIPTIYAELGDVGALIMAGLAFPPTYPMVCATTLGGSCALSIVYLVKKFWASQQIKALDYLNKILESLVKLNNAIEKFYQYITKSKVKANEVKEHMQNIQFCLESERQRKINRDICAEATESAKAMIDSLQNISNLDISQLTRTTFSGVKI